MKPEGTSKHKGKTQQDYEEGNLNYAEALRLLKETEERLDKKRKQIRVDSMKADRGKWHVQENEKKSELHKVIKEENLKLRNQFSVLRAKQFEKVMQMKKESERIRQEGLKKRSLSRLETLENKIRLNHEVREQSLHLTEKIIQKRQQQLEKKRENRLSLYGSRKQSRIVVQQFQASRVSGIKNSMSRERDELMKILKKRQKELEELDTIKTVSSRLKIEKQPSTTQNIRSIDQSMRIYNPSSSHKKARKRSHSSFQNLKESGTMITEI